MPLARVKEIREMSMEDRAKRLNELRTELVRLKTMVRAGGTVENPARVRELRKAIAVVLTIDTEDRLKEQKPLPERKKK